MPANKSHVCENVKTEFVYPGSSKDYNLQNYVWDFFNIPPFDSADDEKLRNNKQKDFNKRNFSENPSLTHISLASQK